MIERLCRMLASAFVDELVSRAVMQGFPTDEDIASIRDHVAPGGAAYAAGRKQLALEVFEWWSEMSLKEVLPNELHKHACNSLIAVLTRSGDGTKKD